MPKRRSRDHLAVSLFPFLSILACVIGVLTLMITALALGQISTDAAGQEGFDRADEYVKLREQVKSDEARAVALARLGTDAKSAEDEAEALREERRKLEAQKKEAAAPAQPAAQVREQAEALRKKNEQMSKELEELKKQIDPLRAEAARLKPDENAGRVTIRPGGTGTNLKPVFVECTAAGITLHDAAPPVVIALAAVAANESFLKLLDAVADSPDRTVIFLVRPAGIATYNHARAIATARFARNGKLAVPGDGPLDLSLFREK